MQITQFYDVDGGTDVTLTTPQITLPQWVGHPIYVHYLVVGNVATSGALNLRHNRADGTYVDIAVETTIPTTGKAGDVSVPPNCQFVFVPTSGNKGRLTLWMPLAK